MSCLKQLSIVFSLLLFAGCSTVLSTECVDDLINCKGRCSEGNKGSCMKMAAFYEEGWGVEENQRRAASLYRRCCRKGTSLGCHYLAAMYEEGRGTAKNKGKAVEYYQKACSGGVAVSCKAVERLEVE